MNPRYPLEGTIVDHGPVHMTAEDYHRATSSAHGSELVPVQRGNQLALPPLPAGAQVIVIQAPAAPTSESAGGKWTPGNVLALAIVAIVGIIALVLLAPLIVAAVQSLLVAALAVGALSVLLIRALRPAPTPEPTKRRRGRRNR